MYCKVSRLACPRLIDDCSDNQGSTPPVYKDLYLRDQAPPHPGEILREDVLPALGLTRAALTKNLGIGTRRLADLLAERSPVSLDFAIRLGGALGPGPRYWLGLQMQYDVWQAEQPTKVRVTRVVWSKGRKAKSGTTRGVWA